MARRASNSNQTGMFIGIGVAVLVILIGTSFFLKTRGAGPENDLPELDIIEAVENANSLRGSSYQITGTVQSKEIRDSGSLIFLRVEKNGSEHFLGVKVPNDLDTVNIEREKDYTFSILFEKAGVATATAVNKL